MPAPADTAHAGFAAAFAAGVGGGALPAGLTAPGEAERRFAVHRNTVAVSLREALARRFPVIARLVGADFFAALAREFIARHPPRSPVLLTWGAAFPGFLADLPGLAAYPFMADVARIELARGRAFHAADAAPVAPAALAAALAAAGAAPERVRLTLHPSVEILRLATPAVSIWAAHQAGSDGHTGLATLAGLGPETALVLRDRRFDVPVAAIGPGDAAFTAALLQVEALLAAAAAAAAAEPGHDPQPLLLRLVRAGGVTGGVTVGVTRSVTGATVQALVETGPEARIPEVRP